MDTTHTPNMGSAPQVLRGEDGRPAFAVLRWTDFMALAAGKTEARAAARAAAIEAGTLDETSLTDEEFAEVADHLNEGAEAFPIEIARRIGAGENPLKVIREYRGLRQAELAEKAGISAIYVSQIETGRRDGSLKTVSALARALNVPRDMLLPEDAA